MYVGYRMMYIPSTYPCQNITGDKEANGESRSKVTKGTDISQIIVLKSLNVLICRSGNRSVGSNVLF